MNLYELNQAGYASLPKMGKSAIAAKEVEVGEWIQDIERTYPTDTAIYFMLLSRDARYFTIFAWDPESTNMGADLAKEIVDLVKNDLGTLKSIERANDAWEFWVTGQDAVTQMYALFDYTKGVIEV